MGSNVCPGSTLSTSRAKSSSLLASASWNSLEDVTASSLSFWYRWNGSNLWLGKYGAKPYGVDQADARCLHIVCHMVAMYGQENELPDSSMSLMRVSMGVFPTSRTKKSCSMTWELTVRRDGRRRSSLPNLVGWLGYWFRQYSSRAHWDFSCRFSIWGTSERPHASGKKKGDG